MTNEEAIKFERLKNKVFALAANQEQRMALTAIWCAYVDLALAAYHGDAERFVKFQTALTEEITNHTWGHEIH